MRQHNSVTVEFAALQHTFGSAPPLAAIPQSARFGAWGERGKEERFAVNISPVAGHAFGLLAIGALALLMGVTALSALGVLQG